MLVGQRGIQAVTAIAGSRSCAPRGQGWTRAPRVPVRVLMSPADGTTMSASLPPPVRVLVSPAGGGGREAAGGGQAWVVNGCRPASEDENVDHMDRGGTRWTALRKSVPAVALRIVGATLGSPIWIAPAAALKKGGHPEFRMPALVIMLCLRQRTYVADHGNHM